MDDKIVSYPFGPMAIFAILFAAVMSADIGNQKTFIDVGEMSADATLDLVIDPCLNAGAELVVKALSDGTGRDLTLGTGFTGNVIVGTISKTNVMTFMYDGTSFLHTGTKQID